MRQVVTIQEKPRMQARRLFLLTIDAAAVAWALYVGVQIFGI